MNNQIMPLEAKEQLDTALSTLKTLRTEVKRAMQAEIEVPVKPEDLDELERRILAIKRAYFPTAGKRT